MSSSKKSAAAVTVALAQAKSQAGELQEKIAPAVEEARERTVAMVGDARDKLGDLAETVGHRLEETLPEKASPAVVRTAVTAKVAERAAEKARREAEKTAAENAAEKAGRRAARKAAARATAAAMAGRAARAGDQAKDEVKDEVKEGARGSRRTAATVGVVTRKDAKAAAKAAGKAAKSAKKARKASQDAGGSGGGKLRKLLFLTVLGGAVFAVVRRITAGSSEPQWQSTAPGRPVPPPAPTETTMAEPTASVTGLLAAENAAADPDATDVAGGGTPDEAAADAMETPRAPTTPDAPAEEIVIAPLDPPLDADGDDRR